LDIKNQEVFYWEYFNGAEVLRGMPIP